MTLRFDCSARRIRRVLAALAISNVVLMIGTISFMAVWGRLHEYSPFIQRVITLGLVQFHLGTENVVAAWYSSMMLLTVALCCGAAFSLDRDRAGSSGWALMAAAFLLLSFDEIGSMHERVGMIAALNPFGDRALGWVFILALPIAAVAAVMSVFAWRHLRCTPLVLGLVLAGVALFVSDPVLEQFEMSLLHESGGARSLFIHDVLLVFEEGVAELFGTWCFLAGVLIYLHGRLGGRPFEMCAGPRSRRAALAIGASLAAAAYVAQPLVDRLPAGDTGVPANWFPAAGAFIAALITLGVREGDGDRGTTGGRALAGFAAVSVVLSAYFAAALFAYRTAGRFDTIRDAGAAIFALAYVATAVTAAVAGGRGWMLAAGGAVMAAALAVQGAGVAPLATLASVFTSAGLLTETSVSHGVSMESWRLEDSAAERRVATLARSSGQPGR